VHLAGFSLLFIGISQASKPLFSFGFGFGFGFWHSFGLVLIHSFNLDCNGLRLDLVYSSFLSSVAIPLLSPTCRRIFYEYIF
jgi:hypothetical protein